MTRLFAASRVAKRGTRYDVLCGCALTIDTMRQNPSELTLRAELSG
jgi:hypothetical protein